jgi:hypothetical protein
MITNNDDLIRSTMPEKAHTSADSSDPTERADWQLRRWQVSFRSGESWYPVGEFVALDARPAPLNGPSPCSATAKRTAPRRSPGTRRRCPA